MAAHTSAVSLPSALWCLPQLLGWMGKVPCGQGWAGVARPMSCSPLPQPAMVEGCQSSLAALDVLANPGDRGCCASAPLQPSTHLFQMATSKSPREQRCRMRGGCPIASPAIVSRSLSAHGQVESCSPFGFAHPEGSLLVQKSRPAA